MLGNVLMAQGVQGAVPPKSFLAQIGPGAELSRVLGGDPGAREKGLADPQSDEKLLVLLLLEAGTAEKTPAQRELGWLRPFLGCVKA